METSESLQEVFWLELQRKIDNYKSSGMIENCQESFFLKCTHKTPQKTFQTNEQSVNRKNLVHQCRSWLMLYYVSKYFMVHWSAKLQGLAQCSILYTIQQCFNTFLRFLINTNIRRQFVNCSSLNLLVFITVLYLRIAYENLVRTIKHSLTVTFHLILLDKFLWIANRGDHKLSWPESEHVNKFCSKLILNLWKK